MICVNCVDHIKFVCFCGGMIPLFANVGSAKLALDCMTVSTIKSVRHKRFQSIHVHQMKHYKDHKYHQTYSKITSKHSLQFFTDHPGNPARPSIGKAWANWRGLSVENGCHEARPTHQRLPVLRICVFIHDIYIILIILYHVSSYYVIWCFVTLCYVILYYIFNLHCIILHYTIYILN
jgi:hypothetical protein